MRVYFLTLRADNLPETGKRQYENEGDGRGRPLGQAEMQRPTAPLKQALGHTVRLMPPAYVKPDVKRQKNDAADAEAMCEAATRTNMRFVQKSQYRSAQRTFLNFILFAQFRIALPPGWIAIILRTTGTVPVGASE